MGSPRNTVGAAPFGPRAQGLALGEGAGHGVAHDDEAALVEGVVDDADAEEDLAAEDAEVEEEEEKEVALPVIGPYYGVACAVGGPPAGDWRGVGWVHSLMD